MIVNAVSDVVKRIEAEVTDSFIRLLISKIPLFLNLFYDNLPDFLKRMETEKLHVWVAEYCAEHGIFNVDECVTRENILAALDRRADELDIDKSISKLPRKMREFALEIVDIVARLIAAVKRSLNVRIEKEEDFLNFLMLLLDYSIATAPHGNSVPREVVEAYRRLEELRRKYPNLTRRIFGWLLDKALEVESSGDIFP